MDSIKRLINERHSVRAYTKKKIEAEKKETLKELMQALETEDFRFELIDYTFDENVKIGTYGMISGAHSFIVGILTKDQSDKKEVAMDFGESFEQLILKATALELSTCWMVSTFNSSSIEGLINLDPSETVVMVSPVGYGNEDSLKHRFTRFIIKADQREPWEKIFFNNNFNNSLSKTDNSQINDILEGLRQSPSAANKQPWRIVKSDMTFDFYIEPKTYMDEKNQEINVTYNDMGIARYHFKSMAEYYNYNTRWFKKDNSLDEKIYVGSMSLEKGN